LQDGKIGPTVTDEGIKPPHMTWWERLRKAMEARRLSPEDVAKRAGVNLKSLYGYLKGDVAQPRGDVVRRLAHAVQTTELALRYGGDAPPNVVPLKKVPLLDMTKLAKLKPAESPLSLWDGTSVVSVPADVPDGAFGVTLPNAANAPEFQHGDIVICDPGAEVLPGRYVVAVLTESEEAHFAKFRPQSHGNASRFTLVQQNEDYPTIEVGGKVKGFIIARCIKHIRDI
jgi:transcriptional regulator with XRE-family HTH domain